MVKISDNKILGVMRVEEGGLNEVEDEFNALC